MESGYTLFDPSARHRYRNLEAFLSVESRANAEWREARTFLGGLAIRF